MFVFMLMFMKKNFWQSHLNDKKYVIGISKDSPRFKRNKACGMPDRRSAIIVMAIARKPCATRSLLP